MKTKTKAPNDHYLGNEVFKDEWKCKTDKDKYLVDRKKDRKGNPKVDLRVAYEE